MNDRTTSPAELYDQRAARYEALSVQCAARSRLVSNLRGLAFGVAVIAGLVFLFGGAKVVAGLISALGAIAFIGLVVIHGRVIGAESDARRRARVNRNAHARCTGAWHGFFEDGARFAEASHPYAEDLDVFGPSSLFQRINVAHTYYGQRTLAGFLTEPATVDVVRARQEAALALAPELDLRQNLEASALALTDTPEGFSVTGRRSEEQRDPPDPDPFLQWAEQSPRLSKRRGIVFCAYAFPPVTLLLIIGASMGGWPAAAWALPLALQIIVAFSARAETASVFAATSATEGAFVRYGPMLKLVENIDVDAKMVRSLAERTKSAGVRPSVSMRRFQRLLGWFELRHNGLVHPFVNALLLWDVHCVLGLERWQVRAGRHARQWFEVLGELEALSCLAGLAYDRPSFAFPEVTEGPSEFVAEGLGHPLIDERQRVTNDIRLPEPGRALLITGSNMSGKSTLLRAMGLAAVMALAGGPVCASRLRLARCRIRSSIRVRDSLEQGVSRFYAEVRKLKGVLDASRGDDPVLFLLDEILHGTNSAERQIGARWVLAELLERNAIGAVSTHDMELCKLTGPLMDRVDQFHFRESVEGDRMTFDFRLRPGPVRGGNALRLMRMLGIAVPLEPGKSSSDSPKLT